MNALDYITFSVVESNETLLLYSQNTWCCTNQQTFSQTISLYVLKCR